MQLTKLFRTTASTALAISLAVSALPAQAASAPDWRGRDSQRSERSESRVSQVQRAARQRTTEAASQRAAQREQRNRNNAETINRTMAEQPLL